MATKRIKRSYSNANKLHQLSDLVGAIETLKELTKDMRSTLESDKHYNWYIHGDESSIDLHEMAQEMTEALNDGRDYHRGVSS